MAIFMSHSCGILKLSTPTIKLSTMCQQEVQMSMTNRVMLLTSCSTTG